MRSFQIMFECLHINSPADLLIFSLGSQSWARGLDSRQAVTTFCAIKATVTFFYGACPIYAAELRSITAVPWVNLVSLYVGIKILSSMDQSSASNT